MTTSFNSQPQELIDRLALAVGFQSSAIEQFDNAVAIPLHSCLWTASYADMLAIWSELSDAEIRRNVRIGQEWLDVRCMRRERSTGRVIDAYLVIILNEEPHKALYELVRASELDSTACRKHFVWPSEAHENELRWSRVFKITVVGLPPSPLSSSAMTNTPKLFDEFQINLLDDIKTLRPAIAARQHGEPVRGHHEK